MLPTLIASRMRSASRDRIDRLGGFQAGREWVPNIIAAAAPYHLIQYCLSNRAACACRAGQGLRAHGNTRRAKCRAVPRLAGQLRVHLSGLHASRNDWRVGGGATSLPLRRTEAEQVSGSAVFLEQAPPADHRPVLWARAWAGEASVFLSLWWDCAAGSAPKQSCFQLSLATACCPAPTPWLGRLRRPQHIQ